MTFKKIISLTLITVMMFSLSACSKTETKNTNGAADDPVATKLLTDATALMEEMTSYDGKLDLYFDFENTEGNLDANVTTDIDVYNTDNIHITIDTTLDGDTSGSSEFYVKEPQLVGGDKTIYMFYNDEWFQSSADDDTLYYLLGQYDLPEVVRVLLIASTQAQVVSEEESVEGVKATRVDAIIDEDLIANTLIYTGVFVATGMNALTEDYLVGAKAMPISFWIDGEGRVIKTEFDAGAAYQTISDNLFDRVKDLEEYEDAQKLIINSYKLEILIEDINSAKEVEFPEEVLNATVIEEDESSMQ